MKKQVKSMVRVPNVRIGQDVCAVRFKIVKAKQTVKCMTKGQKPLFIRCEGNKFIGSCKGQVDQVTAGHPSQAFAKAVKEFWTLW
jgi:hypothetical protein